MLNLCSKLSTSKLAKVRALCSSWKCQYFPNPRWIGSLVAEGCLTVQSGLGLILGLRVSMIHGGAQPSILFTKPECCQTTLDMQMWKDISALEKRINSLHQSSHSVCKLFNSLPICYIDKNFPFVNSYRKLCITGSPVSFSMVPVLSDLKKN